jgi:sugar transferase (PEP-CTERM/EpsH1 system associated)
VGNLLYLVHRMPYPPNKGDKVRSYHLLKHLQQHHRVFLGTFIDDPQDAQHLDTLQKLCPDQYVAQLHPPLAKLRSLTCLLRQEALSLGYYRDAGLRAWVSQVSQKHRMDATVVFSSVMAMYAPPSVPMLVDFVDVDSAKWTQYASARPWPLSWLYRREGRRLLAYERTVAASARRSFFVTPNEAELFKSVAVEVASTVDAIKNGVDSEFFTPDAKRANPFAAGEQALVFTGAMDYWPNVDGVAWFVADMLPQLLLQWPQLRFYIVGRSPTPQVLALASERVVVTGTVPDVRPYLQHACAVVAPLRVARGIQNKILEAMAMARPVVTVPSCADAIGAGPQQGVFFAPDASGIVRAVSDLLQQPERCDALGQAARQCVLDHYSWQAHLSLLDTYLPNITTPPQRSP